MNVPISLPYKHTLPPDSVCLRVCVRVRLRVRERLCVYI